MLLSLNKNGLDSLFKEVRRVFKAGGLPTLGLLPSGYTVTDNLTVSHEIQLQPLLTQQTV